jgi:glutaredoxin
MQVNLFLSNIPHEKLDISYDEAAKALWKKNNGGSTELPMLLIDGVRPGVSRMQYYQWKPQLTVISI